MLVLRRAKSHTTEAAAYVVGIADVTNELSRLTPTSTHYFRLLILNVRILIFSLSGLPLQDVKSFSRVS